MVILAVGKVSVHAHKTLLAKLAAEDLRFESSLAAVPLKLLLGYQNQVALRALHDGLRRVKDVRLEVLVQVLGEFSTVGALFPVLCGVVVALLFRDYVFVFVLTVSVEALLVCARGKNFQ